jgi:hypothetical protein
MGMKLMRIATTSLMLLSLWPARDALAASTDADQKMLDARQNFPANSFVVMEAQLFEGGHETAKLCFSMVVTIKSDEGKTVNILTRELSLFDRANGKFGGAAVFASRHLYGRTNYVRIGPLSRKLRSFHLAVPAIGQSGVLDRRIPEFPVQPPCLRHL